MFNGAILNCPFSAVSAKKMSSPVYRAKLDEMLSCFRQRRSPSRRYRLNHSHNFSAFLRCRLSCGSRVPLPAGCLWAGMMFRYKSFSRFLFALPMFAQLFRRSFLGGFEAFFYIGLQLFFARSFNEVGKREKEERKSKNENTRLRR